MLRGTDMRSIAPPKWAVGMSLRSAFSGELRRAHWKELQAAQTEGPARAAAGEWPWAGAVGVQEEGPPKPAGAQLDAVMNSYLFVGPRGPPLSRLRHKEGSPPAAPWVALLQPAEGLRLLPGACRVQRTASHVPAVRVRRALGVSGPASPSVWRVLALPRSGHQGPQGRC